MNLSPIRVSNLTAASDYEGNHGGAGSGFSVSLPTNMSLMTKLRKFSISGTGVTVEGSRLIQITGCIGGPLYYELVETVSAGSAYKDEFDPPLPATALNTAITLTVPAQGGGGTVAVVLYGELGFP